MKKTGILNAQLAGYIAALGHMDMFLIGDAGMPIPKGIPVVSLKFIRNPSQGNHPHTIAVPPLLPPAPVSLPGFWLAWFKRCGFL